MGHAWESSPREMWIVNSLMLDEDSGLYYGAANSTEKGSAIGLSSEDLTVERMIERVEQFERDGEMANSDVARLLRNHLTAVGHYEGQGSVEKAVKHMTVSNSCWIIRKSMNRCPKGRTTRCTPIQRCCWRSGSKLTPGHSPSVLPVHCLGCH